MRKYNLVFLVIGLVIAAAFFGAGAPGQGITNTSMAVQIPIELTLALTAFLLALLSLGFLYILKSIGLDLTSYAAPLSISLSTFVIGLAQHWIDLSPVQYDPTIQLALNVLVVVVGGLGVIGFFLKPAAKG